MRDSSPLDAELNAFEQQLAALSPRARLDRDGLMFAAGMRAGRRRSRRAGALAAAASMTCGALLAVLVTAWQLPDKSAPPGAASSNVARVDGEALAESQSNASDLPAGMRVAPDELSVVARVVPESRRSGRQ